MERIGDSVRRVSAGTSLPDVGVLAAVTSAWPAAVGDAISRAAWPARISRDGTLHVATTSSTWAFELGALQPQILERLREALGDDAPPALRFAPGPVPEPPSELSDDRSRAVISPTAEDRSRAAVLAAAIDDRELRESVARAAAASLARRRSDRGF